MARRRGSGDTHRHSVIIVGLGVFGRSVAETLVALGHDVLGVDEDPEVVASLAPAITHVTEADGANDAVLRQLGAGDFSRGLVAVGDIEASVLAASNLIDLGVQEVWAKALSDRHGRILERLGVRHVVSPEREQGRRVGHLIGGAMLDFIEVDEGWAIVQVPPLPEYVGQTLRESRIRDVHHLAVVGTKAAGRPFVVAGLETVVREDDTLIVAGQTRACEAFSAIVAAAREDVEPS